MSFLKFLPKRNKRGFSKKPNVDPALLNFDLLYQLTYMSAMASTGLPRATIFEMAAKLPSTAATYFRDVDDLVKSLRYRHAEAVRVVGERSDRPEIKSLFLRMSSYLASGEPEVNYLSHEAKMQSERYVNVYENTLESLQKWTDAFAALGVSSALIVVVATISTVIFDLGAPFVMALIALMLGTNAFGAWVLSRASPKEIKIIQGPKGERAQKKPRTFFIFLVPTAFIIASFMWAAGMNMGPTLIVSGLVLFPVGYAARKFDATVSNQDKDISTFLRLLGTTASSTNITTTEAMSRIDMRTVSYLAPNVRRLHVRLKSKVRQVLCWDRFVEETGSEMINRSVRIFTDAVRLGGDADEVGRRAALLASDTEFLRAKRHQVAQTFGWLTLAMHAAIVFLLIFVLEIVTGFGTLVSGSGAGAGSASSAAAAGAGGLSFSFGNLALLRAMIVPIVFLLSIVNALAPNIAEGGYSNKFFFFFSFTLVIGGGALSGAPMIGAVIFAASAT